MSIFWGSSDFNNKFVGNNIDVYGLGGYEFVFIVFKGFFILIIFVNERDLC